MPRIHAHRFAATAARHGGLAAVIAAATLWGLGGTLAGKLFGQGADPLEVVAFRTWIALAGLTVLSVLARRRAAAARPAGAAPRRAPVPWPWVIGFGVSVSVANAGLFLAIQRLPVAVALVLQNLAPAFVMAWTLAATRRAPSLRMLAGLAAALVGVALVVELPTTPLGGLDLPGIGFGLLTAAGVACFSAFGGHAARVCGALTANTWAFGVAGVLWLAFQAAHGVPDLFHHPRLLLGAAVIGVFGTLLPFLLYSWGTARVGAQAGAVNISLEPLAGAVLAWVWLGQALNALQLVGTAVLLGGIVHLQRAERREPAAPPAPAAGTPDPLPDDRPKARL
ncbi:EamA family transporter [Kitasatospora sp. NPDC088346]|uniref:EamA family transporter n=1 Tax=Kitasatospora sp. NPDC088346 TaxID=3364073 RepID=UPI00381BD303